MTRYAETQSANNGIRYRDWVCTFSSPASLERCRLDSHVLSIPSHFLAHVPWKRDHSRPPRWVEIRSSLPLEPKVLHDRSEPNTQDFQAFVRTVKARLLQDLKTSLPLRHEHDPHSPHHPIDRLNISTYLDERNRHILIVYAPNHGKQDQFEFVSMTLLDP